MKETKMTQSNKTKLEKKSTIPTSQKTASHHQNTTISPSRLPTPETSFSTTLPELTPNTNQQQDEEGKLLRIVKFTSYSFKETFYRQHKNNIKIYTSNQRKKELPIKINIKLQPSLTSQ